MESWYRESDDTEVRKCGYTHTVNICEDIQNQGKETQEPE